MCYQYENEFEWQVFLWRKCVYGIFTCMLRLYHVFLYTSAICGPLAQWRSRGLIIPWLQVRVLQGPPGTGTERLFQAFRFLLGLSICKLSFPWGAFENDGAMPEFRESEKG